MVAGGGSVQDDGRCCEREWQKRIGPQECGGAWWLTLLRRLVGENKEKMNTGAMNVPTAAYPGLVDPQLATQLRVR